MSLISQYVKDLVKEASEIATHIPHEDSTGHAALMTCLVMAQLEMPNPTALRILPESLDD